MTCLLAASVGVWSCPGSDRSSGGIQNKRCGTIICLEFSVCARLSRWVKSHQPVWRHSYRGDGCCYEQPLGTYRPQAAYVVLKIHAVKTCTPKAGVQEPAVCLAGSEQEKESARRALATFLQERSNVSPLEAERIAEAAPHYVSYLIGSVRERAQRVNEHVGHGDAFYKLCCEFLNSTKSQGVEPYLESVGVHIDKITNVSQYSRWGLSPVSGVVAKINFLLGIGLEPKDIGRTIQRYPRILSTSIPYLQQKIDYLSSLGLTQPEVLRLIKNTPQTLGFSVKHDVKDLPIVELLKELGVRDMSKVIARAPQLLTLNLENNLKGAIRYLEEIGIKGTRLARLIETHPSVLCRRIERKVEFLQSLGLTIESGSIARIILQCPTMSIHSIESRIEYMMSVGLSREEVMEIIGKSPSFLSKSINNTLAPRIAYLTTEMHKSVHELVKAPNFLSSSMEVRIKPRHQVLSELTRLGVLEREYSLSTFVSWTDDTFCEKFVNNAPEHVKEMWAPARENGAKIKLKKEGAWESPYDIKIAHNYGVL